MGVTYNEFQISNVDAAVQTFLKLNQGDEMIIQAHLLNPLLRIIEIMERVCIVETMYKDSNGKKVVLYKVKPGVRFPEASGFCPMTWQVVYTNNPYYNTKATTTSSYTLTTNGIVVMNKDKCSFKSSCLNNNSTYCNTCEPKENNYPTNFRKRV